MNIHIVACRVFTRSLSALTYKAPNRIEITWLPQGLHDTPAILHAKLEQALEEIYDQVNTGQIRRKPDCIVLGYGLCSNATVGIAAREIPLIMPKTDDCIALFLGSQARYMDYFTRYKGTFWLNDDWVENSPDMSADYVERRRAELMEQFDGDEDTVDYLMSLDTELIKNYSRVGYILSPVFNNDAVRKLAQDYAGRHGFEFMEVAGDNSMLEQIVSGRFDGEKFLTVPPGFKIEYSDGPERMIAVPV